LLIIIIMQLATQIIIVVWGFTHLNVLIYTHNSVLKYTTQWFVQPRPQPENVLDSHRSKDSVARMHILTTPTPRLLWYSHRDQPRVGCDTHLQIMQINPG
jgi:hypothetical protein